MGRDTSTTSPRSAGRVVALDPAPSTRVWVVSSSVCGTIAAISNWAMLAYRLTVEAARSDRAPTAAVASDMSVASVSAGTAYGPT